MVEGPDWVSSLQVKAAIRAKEDYWSIHSECLPTVSLGYILVFSVLGMFYFYLWSTLS